MGAMRIEHDDAGAVEIPADALWGVRTARALDACGLSGVVLADRPGLVVALAEVHLAAALANRRCGRLGAEHLGPLVAAASAVAAGHHADSGVVDLLHPEATAALVANVGEVLVHLANSETGRAPGSGGPVDGRHVTMGQDPADVLAAALAVAVHRAATAAAAATGSPAAAAAADKSEQTRGGGAPGGVHGAARDLHAASAALLAVRVAPLPPDDPFAATVVAALADVTGLPLVPADAGDDGLGHLAVAHALVRLTAAVRQRQAHPLAHQLAVDATAAASAVDAAVTGATDHRPVVARHLLHVLDTATRVFPLLGAAV